MSESRILTLEQASVPEWDIEDQLTGTLGTELVEADPQEAQEMLRRLRLELPDALDHHELAGWAAKRHTPLDESLIPATDRFDFYLVEVPLTILIPPDAEEGRRLVRLRLTVTLASQDAEPAVTYDLFPTNAWTTKIHDYGEVGFDVGKLLTFVGLPATDVLSLKLKVPIKWTSRHVQIRTSPRMNNPVEWYVTDRSINNGLTTYLIARVAKGAPVALRVDVVGELRRPGLLGKITKARFRAGTKPYAL